MPLMEGSESWVLDKEEAVGQLVTWQFLINRLLRYNGHLQSKPIVDFLHHFRKGKQRLIGFEEKEFNRS